MKKTNLSMKCNLNHKQSTLYLDLMEGLELIQTECSVLHGANNGGIIRLTRRGRNYYEKEFVDTKNIELEKVIFR